MYIFINKQLVGGMGYLDVAGRKRERRAACRTGYFGRINNTICL
jgi:hypothetical protein